MNERLITSESNQPVFTFLGVVEKGGRRVAEFDLRFGAKTNRTTRSAEELTEQIGAVTEAVKNWSKNADKHAGEAGSNITHRENAKGNLSAFQAALKAFGENREGKE